MNPIAISSGSITIYWSAIIVALGILACFCMTYSLFTSHGGKGTTVWFLLIVGTILSVFFSRWIHWYCHAEQYASMMAAITDYSIGSYCVPGVLLGVLLAGLMSKWLHMTKNTARLFDCLAPGAALGLALIRLSAFFNSSCRSKIAVNTPALQHLPLASPIDSSNPTDYRFATFFVTFLLLLVLFVYLLSFFFKRRRYPMKAGMGKDGHVARMFLLWYSAMELVLDSTRYDSSFVRSNGFVSLVQIVSAVCLLVIFVIYSVRSVKANRLKWYHFLMWILWLAALAGVGVTEYLVQRHGNWYLGCYSGMAGACLALGLVTYIMYLTVCDRQKANE